MDPRRAYILLPGIHSNPSDWRNWAPRMTTDILMRTHAAADEFRYWTTAVTRGARMAERARYVARLITRYWRSGFEPVVVAHSNGCEIVRRAIPITPAIIHSIHLLAAPINPDFEQNGMGAALSRGKIGHIHLYLSKGDSVINSVARWLGWPLGYGTLGADGPHNLCDSVADQVTCIWRNPFGHVEWFAPAHWEQTFHNLTVAERIHP